MKLILNLSDYYTFQHKNWENLLKIYSEYPWKYWKKMPVSGVRFGIETCSILLKKLSKETVKKEIAWLKEHNIQAWFVFPVLRQLAAEHGEMLLETLISEGVDGIIINDFALLSMLEKKDPDCRIKRIFGRCFDKRMRDPRFAEASSEKNMLLGREYQSLMSCENITCMEWEGFGNLNNTSSVEQAVHIPYTLVTFSNLCELSGLDYDIHHKFKSGDCKAPCLKVCATGHAPFLASSLYQFGNALYMQCQPAALINRWIEKSEWLIYTPWSEYRRNGG